MLIDKLVQMTRLEKVKLLGIKLEDKPKPKKEAEIATAAKKSGILRKSLGGLFKDKQTADKVV